nr:hypothetical protein [Candidatus Arsenophonus triatominarum]
MSGYPCIKNIYKTFLQVSSVRYSGLALSEVSPSPLSHDTISRGYFRPKNLWRLIQPQKTRTFPKCSLLLKKEGSYQKR